MPLDVINIGPFLRGEGGELGRGWLKLWAEEFLSFL